MSQMKFWYASGACSLAPHILLHEVGAEFEAVRTDITPAGANFPVGFEKINPKLRVPVLSVDGNVITEVPAIATFIATIAPQQNLMGRDALETARVYEWMVWISGSVHTHGFGCLWRPQRFSNDISAHAGIAEKGAQVIKDCFALAESRIVGPFALGNAFTAVDPYLYVFYRWGNLIGIDMDAAYPKFANLGKMLATRTAFAKATTIEQVDPHGRS